MKGKGKKKRKVLKSSKRHKAESIKGICLDSSKTAEQAKTRLERKQISGRPAIKSWQRYTACG